MKECTQYHAVKPLAEFHRHKRGTQGRHSWCKGCYNAYKKDRSRNNTPEMRRKWNLSGRYGLTEDDVNVMIAMQGGKCTVCEGPLKNYRIDHDHVTGKVRGILCHRCNLLIAGMEDPEFKTRAEMYLAKPR